MVDYNGTFEMVNPDELVVDHQYQRRERPTLIQHIAQNPSWEAFGVIVAFKRKNGMMYVADGQQRLRGVMRSQEPPKRVPVLIFELEAYKDEAAVFATINEFRKALLPLEKHKAKVEAEDSAALAVERAVAKAGFAIGTGATLHEQPHTIQAVSALNDIYNDIGEEGVTQTLTCIRDAWPDDGVGISTHVLRGVAALYQEQGDKYNRGKLTTALRRTTPAKLLRKMRELRLEYEGSLARNMRRAFQTECGLKMPRDLTKFGSN